MVILIGNSVLNLFKLGHERIQDKKCKEKKQNGFQMRQRDEACVGGKCKVHKS